MTGKLFLLLTALKDGGVFVVTSCWIVHLRHMLGFGLNEEIRCGWSLKLATTSSQRQDGNINNFLRVTRVLLQRSNKVHSLTYPLLAAFDPLLAAWMRYYLHATYRLATSTNLLSLFSLFNYDFPLPRNNMFYCLAGCVWQWNNRW